MKWLLLLLLFVSCGKKEQQQIVSVLPNINAETQTDITIWSWDVAAVALQSLIPEFNELYPNISINVVEFGGTGPVLEKSQVALNSGKGMPDILQVETELTKVYAETYPQRFLDMKPYFDPTWEQQVDPSKIYTSYDSEGRLVAFPWDSGPVVLFYRDDYFKQAGIDPDSIKTWDDYIIAGEKLQEALPNIKMTGFSYTGNSSLWRILMTQAGTGPINTNDQITINSLEAQEALKLVQKMRQEISMDLIGWSGLVQSAKTGAVASYIMGGWWSGTLKDQAPEQAGKWKIMKIPSNQQSTTRSSSLGGSMLTITAPNPLKQAAALAFLKFALTSIDNQIAMLDNYGLFPSFTPVYSDERFKQGDPYFGGQDVNSIMGEVVIEIPPVSTTSEKFAEISAIGIAAYDRSLNLDEDVSTILEEAAEQLKSSTGKEIAQ